MFQLNFDLLRLQDGDRQGSYGTRRARGYALAQAYDTLHRLGYCSPQAGARGQAHRRAGRGMAAAGSVERVHAEPYGAPTPMGEEDLEAWDRAQGQRQLSDRRAGSRTADDWAAHVPADPPIGRADLRLKLTGTQARRFGGSVRSWLAGAASVTLIPPVVGERRPAPVAGGFGSGSGSGDQ